MSEDSNGQGLPKNGLPIDKLTAASQGQVARDLANSLWIVPTPIGNMTDLSFRALACLSQVAVIFCEDTRVTEQLLKQVGVARLPRLIRADQHTELKDWSGLFETLDWSKGAAMVSDAGTPGVSDPGSGLVAAALKHCIQLRSIPGPSAVSMLVSLLPWPAGLWGFRGFFPREDSDQEKEWRSVIECNESILWFESPRRISATLQFLAAKDPTRSCLVAKELTKIHESVWSGSLQEVMSQVLAHLDQEGELGEWVFALAPSARNQKEVSAEDQLWWLPLKLLLEAGVKPSDASRRISDAYAAPKNQVYQAALNSIGKINPEK